MPSGMKHLVKCRCVMHQFKKMKDPPRHQFIVFSILNDDSTVVPKFAQCNNCGLIHKVVDICKSEIIEKKEDSQLVLGIEDIKVSIGERISNLLESNRCDLPTWEAAQFILENKSWGEFVVLTSESEDGVTQGKVLQILGENLLKVVPFSREEKFSKG